MGACASEQTSKPNEEPWPCTKSTLYSALSFFPSLIFLLNVHVTHSELFPYSQQMTIKCLFVRPSRNLGIYIEISLRSAIHIRVCVWLSARNGDCHRDSVAISGVERYIGSDCQVYEANWTYSCDKFLLNSDFFASTETTTGHFDSASILIRLMSMSLWTFFAKHSLSVIRMWVALSKPDGLQFEPK